MEGLKNVYLWRVGQGCVLIENCDSAEEHRAFEVKLFEDPNGVVTDNDSDYPIRLVLSSFWWQGSSKGIPDGKSDCATCEVECDGCQTAVFWPAYDGDSCGCVPSNAPLTLPWYTCRPAASHGRLRFFAKEIKHTWAFPVPPPSSPCSCRYDDEYTRPHRDLDVVNAMRGWMGLEPTDHGALGLAACAAKNNNATARG